MSTTGKLSARRRRTLYSARSQLNKQVSALTKDTRTPLEEVGHGDLAAEFLAVEEGLGRRARTDSLQLLALLVSEVRRRDTDAVGERRWKPRDCALRHVAELVEEILEPTRLHECGHANVAMET